MEAILQFWLFLGVFVGIPCLIVQLYMRGRRKMALEDPGRWRRFREWEDEETARLKGIGGDATQACVKAAGVGMDAANALKQ